MTFAELKNKADTYLGPIVLESIQSFKTRLIMRKILFYFFIIVLCVSVFFSNSIANYISIFTLRAIAVLILIVWIKYLMLEAMYLSFYFRKDKTMQFELAKLVNDSDITDLTKSFLENENVKGAFLRCGVDISIMNNFFLERDDLVKDIEITIERKDLKSPVTFIDYANAIFKTDRNLERYLNLRGVSKQTFLGALDWVLDNVYLYKKQFIWWSRDHLIRIPSIGRNWSYGQAYLLEKYARAIYTDPIYYSIETRWEIYSKYVFLIEQVLLKQSGANALMLVPTNYIGMTIVASFAKMIANGRAHTELEDKRIYVLDVNAIIDSTAEKTKFENEIEKVILQAQEAENVVIVIPNFAECIEQALNINSDLSLILSNLIISNRANIIAISNEGGYHSTLETNKNLLNNFEKVEIKDLALDDGLSVLKDMSSQIEYKQKVFILYTTLEKITESVNKYFSDSVFSDKVFNLLQEVVIHAKSRKHKVITPEDVLEVVNLKTGIPVGKINSVEKDELMNLETMLHKRVVGQEQAIKVIAEALRRARMGIQNPNRPMGTFLFMGPTGVGKTETTKALAEILFKDENKIIRLDMSEFNSFDSVSKLIGDGESVGYLSKKIRENPYGVLLLDEFEKSHNNVHDLFSQILDEGSFVDSRGEKIDAKNTIIIATSNAESDLIYRLSKEGANLSEQKDLIINTAIQDHVFKPELINRFDGVIFFHPLNSIHLREIAKLMIDKLNKRLEAKGLSIVIDNDLLEFLAKNGINPQFGAREMNRLIQDKIESLVAKSFISGEIKSGREIELIVKDNELVIKHPRA